MRNLPGALVVLSFLIACQPEPETQLAKDDQLRVLIASKAPNQSLDFFALPASDDLTAIPQDPKNPLTREKVALGQLLFHESFLGQNSKLPQGLATYSCASCHHASGGFQAGRIQGLGEGGSGFGQFGEGRQANPAYDPDSIDAQPIRTPSILNSAYQELMLWNGQFGAGSLNEGTEHRWDVGTPKEKNRLGFQGVETQAIAGMDVHRLDCREDMVIGSPYEQLFDQAFPNDPVPDRYSKINAALAIAAFERTVLANQSPFQMWLNGDSESMTPLQKEGMRLFFGKASCDACHTGPALSSESFHALGMNDLAGPGVVGPTPDLSTKLGRGGFTGRSADNYKFKTPQLYSLKYNPQLGHGGSFTSVMEILDYKNKAVSENTLVPDWALSNRFIPLKLSDEEISALNAFILEALDDPNLSRYEPSSVPSGSCIPNNDPASRRDRGCS